MARHCRDDGPCIAKAPYSENPETWHCADNQIRLSPASSELFFGVGLDQRGAWSLHGYSCHGRLFNQTFSYGPVKECPQATKVVPNRLLSEASLAYNGDRNQ